MKNEMQRDLVFFTIKYTIKYLFYWVFAFFYYKLMENMSLMIIFMLTSPEGGGSDGFLLGDDEKLSPFLRGQRKEDDFGGFSENPKPTRKYTFLGRFFDVFLEFPGPHRGTGFFREKHGSPVGTRERSKNIKKTTQKCILSRWFWVFRKSSRIDHFRPPRAIAKPTRRLSVSHGSESGATCP